MSMYLNEAEKGPFDDAVTLQGDEGPVARVGYKYMGMLDQTYYVGVELLREPTRADLRLMRWLWRDWVQGKSEILAEIKKENEKAKRFAEFFGFELVAEIEDMELWHLQLPS